jgi:hypothetical protein
MSTGAAAVSEAECRTAELQFLIAVPITQDDGYDAISTALADVSTEIPRRSKGSLRDLDDFTRNGDARGL